MNRRSIPAAVAALLIACSNAPRAPGIPATLSGDWKQAGVRNPVGAPPLLGRYAPESVWEVTFSGPSPLTVTYFGMASGTVAFELMQKWRAEAASTHFHSGSFFVVIKAPGVEPARLNAIAKELDEALKP
jgi:hypothetical protein